MVSVEKLSDDVSSVFTVDADNEEQAKRKAAAKRVPRRKIENEYINFNRDKATVDRKPLKDYDGNIIQHGVLKHVGRNETILADRLKEETPIYIDHNGRRHKLTQEIAKHYRQHLVL